jgi:hypothetical protein
MMNFSRLCLVAFIFIAINPSLTGQDHSVFLSLSDIVRSRTVETPLSATRFMPVYSFRGIGEWTSPRSVLLVDGIPFSLFPLLQVTPDMLPFPAILFDSANVEDRPTLTPVTGAAGGIIDAHRRVIPSGLTLNAVAMTGSETGDRVLHLYTRKLAGYLNKNKIGPLGMFAVSNRSGAIAYRFSASADLYFFTGGSVDPIVGKLDTWENAWIQNRRYTGSAEFEYTDGSVTYELVGGYSTMSGWELFPFTTAFTRFRSNQSSVILRVRELFPSIAFTAFHHSGLMRTFQQPAEVRHTELGALAQWKSALSHSTILTTTGTAGQHSVNPQTPNGQMFSDSYREFTGGVSLDVDHRFSKRTGFQSMARVDRKGEATMSAVGVSVHHRVDTSFVVHARVQSIATAPGFYERFGYSLVSRQRLSGANEDFVVTGNSFLTFERTHDASLTIVFALSLALSIHSARE